MMMSQLISDGKWLDIFSNLPSMSLRESSLIDT